VGGGVLLGEMAERNGCGWSSVPCCKGRASGESRSKEILKGDLEAVCV
jgi:hypothetical protein